MEKTNFLAELVATFVPAVVIPEENVSSGLEGPVLTEGSSSERRAPGSYNFETRCSLNQCSSNAVFCTADTGIRSYGNFRITNKTNRPQKNMSVGLFPTYLHWTRGQGASEKGRFLPQQGSKRELCAPSRRWWCNPSTAGSSLRAVLVSSWFYRTVLGRYGGECCRSLQLQSMALPSFPQRERDWRRKFQKQKMELFVARGAAVVHIHAHGKAKTNDPNSDGTQPHLAGGFDTLQRFQHLLSYSNKACIIQFYAI